MDEPLGAPVSCENGAAASAFGSGPSVPNETCALNLRSALSRASAASGSSGSRPRRLELLVPDLGDVRELRGAGREQGQLRAAGQHDGSERGVDGRGAHAALLRKRRVPRQLRTAEQRGEVLALQRAERRGLAAAHLRPRVVPDLAMLAGEILVAEEADESFDVIRVDVRAHRELERAVVRRQRGDLRAQARRVRETRAAVDQDAMAVAALAVLDPQAVAVARGQHLDGEHGGLRAPARARARRRGRTRRGDSAAAPRRRARSPS